MVLLMAVLLTIPIAWEQEGEPTSWELMSWTDAAGRPITRQLFMYGDATNTEGTTFTYGWQAEVEDMQEIGAKLRACDENSICTDWSNTVTEFIRLSPGAETPTELEFNF